MVYFVVDNNDQTIKITPEDHVSVGNSYILQITKEGDQVTQSYIGSGVKDGSYLTIELTVSVDIDNFYYYTVAPELEASNVIFKGKAYSVNNLTEIDQPLKWSMYG